MMSLLKDLLRSSQVVKDVVDAVAELKRKFKEEQDFNDHMNVKINGLYAIVDELSLELEELRGLMTDVSEQNRLLAGALRQMATAQSASSASVTLSDPRHKKVPGDDKPN